MTISQYPPAGAIKSKQGTPTLTTGQTTDVTVTAVNPSKARLTLLGWSLPINDVSYQPRIHLLNATTVRIFSYSAGVGGYFPTVSWELVEVY